MPAQALALALPLARIGGHGGYSQVGRPRGETSGGQKRLASSSSCSPPSHPAAVASTSKYTVTTKVWLKDGGRGEVETSKPTSSSTVSMPSWVLSSLPYTQDTYQAKKTQLMIHHEAYTPLPHSFYQSSTSPTSLTISSSIATPALPAWSQVLISTTHQPSCPSPATCCLRTNVPPLMQSSTGVERSSSP